MMKNKIKFGLITIVLTTLVLVSCSKVPQVEIDAAKQAIENAKVAGADVYLSDDFILLQDSMNSVMEGIEAKKSKFFKNYGDAKEQLEAVTKFAQQISQQVDVRKEELKVEVSSTLAEVSSLIEANNNLILEAPRGKEGTSALEVIKQELSAIEAMIVEANAMLENGELLPALDKANTAQGKATSINDELTQVIEKYKANAMKKRG